MSEEDPFDDVRRRIAAGTPLVRHVLEMPIRVSLGPTGAIILDAPMGISGIQDASILRVTLAVSARSLRDALEVLEKDADAQIVLTAKPGAH